MLTECWEINIKIELDKDKDIVFVSAYVVFYINNTFYINSTLIF